MVKVRASVEINRPIESVFEFVSNLDNNVRWSTGTVEVRKLSEGPWTVGTRYVYVRQFLGRKMEESGEVTECDRPTRYAFRSSGAVGGWIFEPVADGTHVTFSMEVEAEGLFSLGESVVEKMFQGTVADDLDTLKTLLEIPGGPSGVWADEE